MSAWTWLGLPEKTGLTELVRILNLRLTRLSRELKSAAAAVGGVAIRKNTGAVVGTRPKLNFIEGTNVTLTVADDAVAGEVDVTIASAGGAGGGVTSFISRTGAVVAGAGDYDAFYYTEAEVTSLLAPKITGVAVRKNTGAVVGTRPQVNLIEGSNVTLTVADDAASGEVDVTIAAAAPPVTSFATRTGAVVPTAGDYNAFHYTEAEVDNLLAPKITGVGVRKNTGALVGTRPKLNLVEGTNITLTVADDATDGEVDVTIAASGGGGGVTSFATRTGAVVAAAGDYDAFYYTEAETDNLLTPKITGLKVRKNTGALVGTRPQVNFIEGSNVTLTVADDAGTGEVDVTIAAAGGGGVTSFITRTGAVVAVAGDYDAFYYTEAEVDTKIAARKWEHFVIALNGSQGGNTVFTSAPAALSEPHSRYRALADLTNCGRVRLLTSVQTVGVAGTNLRAQYSINSGGTWSYLDGATGPTIAITALGLIASAWVNLAAAAKVDVWLRWVTIGGNGTASPAVGMTHLEFQSV